MPTVLGEVVDIHVFHQDISQQAGLAGMTLTELDYQNTVEEPVPNCAQKL